MLRPQNLLLCATALILSLTCSVYALCPVGDVHQDADCEVNWLDLQDFAEQWLNSGCSAPACRADLDGVPGVNMRDFALLAENWLKTGSIMLVINEFMASNDGTIEYPEDSGNYPDWFEIYNYGEEDIDIGGMYVRDDSHWHLIPTGYSSQTTVKAGGYLLLWADSGLPAGPLHVGFGLGKSSDEIGIYDENRNPIDVVPFSNQVDDRSRGRLPDGSNNWITFEIGGATPGSENRGKPVEILISEIMYHPGHEDETPENLGEEYIELFNRGGDPVSLGGWRFTDGVDFTIPGDPILGVGEYFVVAADVNAFTAKYPGVTNFVAGWTGRLSNSGEKIELVDHAGVLVDQVEYSDQGEWAVRQLGPVDYGHRGWEWSEAHDGEGKSLELINPAMPNDYGRNWAATDSSEGTPGAINTVNDDDIAPLILDVEHFPVIPGAGDPVTVTAQIIDESSSGVSATLHYRIDRSTYQNGDEDIYPHHEPNDYNDLTMYDDGAHGDGSAGDGIYGALIPADQNDGFVVEFYVEAADAGANTRTWPAPSMIDGVPEQVTNALYQVDDAFDADTWTPGSQPVYYLIMIGMEKGRILDIGDPSGGEYNSDAMMNLTFVSVDGVETKVRHNAGMRNRGHGSRNNPPNNYRVNFPHDRKWQGADSINLNTKHTYLQVLGNAIFRLAGLVSPEATAAQVRLNGENMAVSDSEMYGSYAHMEVVDGDFAANHFPDDDGGNAYKCMRIDHEADLRYEGTDPDEYRHNYFKRTNTAEDDFSDLIELTYALSDNTPDASYVEEVNRVANIEQWIRFLAVNTVLNNSETTLANGDGDDYYLYRGIEDTRFVLIQHDLDSILGIGDSLGTGYWNDGIFRFITDRTGVPALERLVTHPEFIHRYYWHLRNQIETTFSPDKLDPLLDELLGDFVPADIIQQMKDFAVQRNAHILSLIPSDLTIVSDLPQVSGYYATDANVAVLYGQADAVNTRSVLVNGQSAVWYPVEGEWNVAEPQEPDYDSLVARGASWKYFDEYTDLGPDWQIDVNDSNWAQGNAELGYGDGTEATEIGYIVTNPGTPEEGKNITTYFTHSFEVADTSAYLALSLRILRDDGAVVYLNGTEIARSNMSAGTVDYHTLAASNVYGTDVDGYDMETLYYGGGIYANDDDFTNIDIGLLQGGENTLAVEIHQYQTDGADISFDMELRGLLKDSAPAIGVSINPGINRIIVQAFDSIGGRGNPDTQEVDRDYIDVWYDDGDESTVSGAVATRTLDAASGPWNVTGDITVGNGVTLTIEPGTTLFFNAGTRITVTSGGRLVAEGTQYNRIRLTSVPGGAHWDGVKFDGTLEDNRLAYLDHEFGDGQGESTDVQYSRVTIDNVTWSGTDIRVLNIDHPSVICRNSVFPSVGSTEPLHGVGLSGDEYIIFDGCTFGSATGYNDIIDFTGGRRPGPIFQLYNSIFLGGGDDGPDLDSTDAHIEGCVFMNFAHQAGSDSTSNAIATGSEGFSSEIYVARSIFINNEHDVLLKEDCVLHGHNNVFLNTGIGVISFGEPYRDPPRDPGGSAIMAGNIFWGNAAMFEWFFQDPLPDYGPTGEVIIDYSSLPSAWHYLGADNIDADPLFIDDNSDFALKTDSGALGAGAWGLDMGAMVPAGAAISGEPYAVTYRTDATLTVGGPGIVSYKYSVNSPTGPWSEEISVDVPIVLTGLVRGESYTVYAFGKNSADVWQSEETPAASHTWTIDTSHSQLVINEVLAHTHGTDPDIIELYFDGPQSINLLGMGLTDDPTEPNKFEFTLTNVSTTVISPGEHMILYADLDTGPLNYLGFALSADGEALYLYDKPNPDGSRDLLDSVEFGPQINDFTIGRVGYDREWKLNQMTLGSANIAQPLGDPDTLKINEWLANGQVLFDDDFVELYNPHPLPVSLGGMYMTDDPVAQPNKHQVVPLSFIPPEGYAVFRVNDGNGPSELDFKLSADGEMIGLFDSELNMIDQVLYRPQTTDVSQGRVPNGSSSFEFFDLPTPGVANPSPPITTIVTTVLAAENATKRAIVPTSPNDVGGTWNSDPDFDDSNWAPCIGSPGGVGYETNPTDPVNYVSLITCDVEAQMDGINETCYIRIPFTVDGADLADFNDMTLKIRYDDGFVPYINGVELETARRNSSGTPQWDSGAGAQHGDSVAVLFEYIDVSDYLSALRSGDNVLAIHGLNYGLTSSDFLISAELEATVTTIDHGEFPYPDALDQLAGLRITELMYNAPSGSNYDYVELKNISDTPIQLEGVRFVEGITYEFSSKLLGAGQYVVVVSNLTAFRNFYGYTADVAGEYTGGLSGGGENIVLSLAWPLEAAIMRFEYADTWYPTTDGGGPSLHINDATAHPYLWNDAETWHAASPSPGLP